MNKVLLILLVVLIIGGGFYFYKITKQNYCAYYALNSYRYGMAEEKDKTEMYDSAYKYCSDNYLMIRLRKINDRVNQYFEKK